MLIRRIKNGFFVVQPGRENADVFSIGFIDYSTTLTICWPKELRGKSVRIKVIPVNDVPS